MYQDENSEQKIYAENICINHGYKFPKFGKKTLTYTSKNSIRLQRKSKKITWRHIITMLLKAKLKGKILNSAREK